MSCSRLKPRRHSFSSLESMTGKQMELECSQSVGKENSTSTAVQAAERSRKRPLNEAEVLVSSKKGAYSALAGLQGVLSQEELQVSEDTLCCLPGGV